MTARDEPLDDAAVDELAVRSTHDQTRTDFSDPALAQARARVGSLVGNKWHLDALLGAGGMAAVYAATHRNGTRAALKILHVALSNDRTVRSRFQREGYAANSVGHPGVVRVLDDDVLDDGSPFLVTELLDGETLEDRRERLGGRLSVAEVLTYADALLDVLVAAHSSGVVHRDLKPDNLFLTRSGQLKVLDFGIARIRDLAADSHLTKNGALLGTPRFMPPEQARGLADEVDAQSDLWACGATMFDLLSGRPVFDAPTPHQILMLAATIPAPAFETVWPEVPPSVACLIDRALAFQKKDRWPDARAMQQAVRAAYCDRRGASIAAARASAHGVGVLDPEVIRRGRRASRRLTGRPAAAESPSARSGAKRDAGPAHRDAASERMAAPRRGAANAVGARRPRVPEGLPALHATMSHGISDQTLTPTNPRRDDRSTDRPVVATVPSAPPVSQRVQIALPAFVLGAAIAAAIAIVVRPGYSPAARIDLSPLATPGPAAAEVRPIEAQGNAFAATPPTAATAISEPAPRERASAASPSTEPRAPRRGGFRGSAQTVAPSLATTLPAEVGASLAPAAPDPLRSPARGAGESASASRAVSGTGPIATSIAGASAVPEREVARRNCMRLDEPGPDGGGGSRIVCL